MRDSLRKIYEKNERVYPLYIFVKSAYIITRRFKKINKETCSDLDEFVDIFFKKEDYKKIYQKMIVFRYIYSLTAKEYFIYNFEDASYSERKKFLPRMQTKYYYEVINNSMFRRVLDKKNISYDVFKKYYKREMVCIANVDDAETLLDFIKRHDKFIFKGLGGHGGEGVEIIDSSDTKKLFELYGLVVKNKPFILEELIKQSPLLGCFHENSVNTIRVVTFQYKGDVSILWSFLRTGQGGSAVDNMGSGGFGAFIDVETGKIITDGIDWKGTGVLKHPDSNITFKGYQIPKWDEAVKMAQELAGEMSEMHCVGWDLALTDDGWVLVEGNARPQCVTIQTCYKKGYRDYYIKMYNLVKKLNEEEAEKYVED